MLDTIFNESCLDTLGRTPDNTINLVITSPPYNMNLRIRKGAYTSRQIVEEFSTKYTEFSDNLPLQDYYVFHKAVLNELLRVIRNDGLIFYNIQIVTGSKRAFFKLIGDYSDYLKDIIIWDKGYAQPAMHEQVLNKRTELLLVFEKDYPISRQFRKAGKFKRGTLDDLWEIPRAKGKSKNHTAVFPEQLVSTILENFSVAEQVVYDPFMGTGTTGIVAQKMGRYYMGSEISKQYCTLAEKQGLRINGGL
tara:strand:- start:1364 stop:2110 length:747 start_codon:yes stop_codon:yes gene_type:complete